MTVLAYPQFLWLLLLPLAVFYLLPAAGKMYGDALRVPFVRDILKINNESKYRRKNYQAKSISSFFKLVLSALIWGLIVVALCRPQWVGEPHKARHESRDIMLVVDISTSMLERDFVHQNKAYSRLSAVKSVVSHFADERTDDRIGLIVFGTRAYQQVPLTYDRQSLKETLSAIDAGMAGNSTSIGDAVGLALKYLAQKDNAAKNKVIILLTDGENNDGSLSFPQAIKLAEDEDVKIYTVGMANSTEIMLGGMFVFQSDAGLDEASLKRLAETTQGQYFRVKDFQSLYAVYDQINRLEVQEQEGHFVQETKDLFYYPAALALLLFVLMLTFSGRKLK
ncbi:MAG: VWA domain-containing protein [Alphaproteobacteria bacterium]|nr:VWA domain-containing protein [Alphaproteobacteria bacterium]